MATILLVEDDPLIGLALVQTVRDDVGVDAALATTVAAAIEQLSRGPVVFALLDVNLQGETTYDLARLLAFKGIPFAFASASNSEDVPDDLRSAPFLHKPCPEREIVRLVSERMPTIHADRRHL